MVFEKLRQVFLREGYRCCQETQKGIAVFYQYNQGTFHVAVAIGLKYMGKLVPGYYQALAERIRGLFYHPQEWMEGFPEEVPVCEVELFTLFVGGEDEEEREQLRILCAECGNAWAYLTEEKQLLVYENQPGDFWGLRRVLENMGVEPAGMSFVAWLKGLRGRWLPYTTIVLTAANVAVFLVLEMMGDTEDGLFIAEHGGLFPVYISEGHQWWRILTSSFIHFGAVHLIKNMVVFCGIAPRLERVLGHIWMLMAYLLSAIGGGLLSYFMMMRTGDYAVSAGASGAIFGTIAGLLCAAVFHRGRMGDLTARRLAVMLALCTYYGFSSVGIDNWCHVGGAATGFVVTACALLFRGRVK